MTDATIDEQVERAIRAYVGDVSDWKSVEWDKPLHEVMRDLLAGKFREAPLPEIARPPWPHDKPPRIFETAGCEFCVAVGAPGNTRGWSSFYGPQHDTKRAAIEAWNAVFAVKP